MAAVPAMGAAIAARLGAPTTTVGQPVPAAPADWDVELAHATPTLQEMARRVDGVLTA